MVSSQSESGCLPVVKLGMGYDTVQYLMRHLPIPDQYHAVHRPSDGIESGAGLAGEGHDLLEPGGEAVTGSG
jgi:hypothetical protein